MLSSTRVGHEIHLFAWVAECKVNWECCEEACDVADGEGADGQVGKMKLS